MSLSRRPARVALLSGLALLSVAAGVGVATGATDTSGTDGPERRAAVTAPAAAATSPVTEGEGPGTETVPAREGGEDEGPGTDSRPAPVYGSVTPSTWTLATPKATVYDVPGDLGTRTGSITDRTADIAGTGRAATVGSTEWLEVKVPGATTGWVVGTELTRR